MDTWWTSSPYYNIGIYIGGANRGCSQPNLTAAWVTHNQTAPKKWGLLPIWFGPQMSKSGCGSASNWYSYISTNTTTAYNQGYDEAQSAWTAAGALGMDRTGMPIIVDIEGYGNVSSCRAAAKAYVNGWVTFLHTGIAQLAGVYGSQCGSFINDFASIANPPDFIWFADWDNNPSTATHASCSSLSTWGSHERHKQYKSPHYETHGVQLHIDTDCSDGPVYLDIDFFDSGSVCL